MVAVGEKPISSCFALSDWEFDMICRVFCLVVCLSVLFPAIALAQLGTHEEGYLLPMVYATGDTAPGGQTTFVYRSPADFGKICFMAFSTSDQPMALPGGQVVNWNILGPGGGLDILADLTLNPGAGGAGVFGPIPIVEVLDDFGYASRTTFWPPNNFLVGFQIHVLAFTNDPLAPGGIGRFATTSMIFRNPATSVDSLRILDTKMVANCRTAGLDNILGAGSSVKKALVRMRPNGATDPTQGGILEVDEPLQVHGYNNGPNGINENGGGDDIDLGPVPATWAYNHGAAYGTIDPSTGVFLAGPSSTAQPSDGGPGTGTISASYGGLIDTMPAMSLPPDYVAPPLAAPAGLTGTAVGNDIVLSWTNPVTYSSIRIRRDGATIATLPGTATSYTDVGVAGGFFGVTGYAGIEQSSESTVGVGSFPQPLSLGDDDNQTVQLGFSFSFFGQTYTECRVCSNGRLNFGGSNSQANSYQARWSGWGTTFRSGPPSLGFWSDWSPNQGGTVMVVTSPNQLRVVFSGVPSYNGPGVADFEIILTPGSFTLQDNGTTWMSDDNCIIGFTPGGNISTAGSQNLSSLLPIPSSGNDVMFGEDFDPSTGYDLGVGFTATANNATGSHWAVQ